MIEKITTCNIKRYILIKYKNSVHCFLRKQVATDIGKKEQEEAEISWTREKKE